jgi:hypothetical protein
MVGALRASRLPFLPATEIIGAIERAGLQTEMRLERVGYPGEAETRRT